jgi:hypothetical protein
MMIQADVTIPRSANAAAPPKSAFRQVKIWWCAAFSSGVTPAVISEAASSADPPVSLFYATLRTRIASTDPLLHEGRGQNDGEPDQEQDDRERLHPVRKTDALRQDLYGLEHDPRCTQIDAQNLPERAPVHLLDQSLESAQPLTPI